MAEDAVTSELFSRSCFVVSGEGNREFEAQNARVLTNTPRCNDFATKRLDFE
jgi:hypothetical protein